MVKKNKHDHSEFMRKDNCEKDMKIRDEKVSKIDHALFGDDGCGGIVKDIHDIKAYTGVVRQIIVPIITSIIAALLTAWALTGFHI